LDFPITLSGNDDPCFQNDRVNGPFTTLFSFNFSIVHFDFGLLSYYVFGRFDDKKTDDELLVSIL